MTVCDSIIDIIDKNELIKEYNTCDVFDDFIMESMSLFMEASANVKKTKDIKKWMEEKGYYYKGNNPKKKKLTARRLSIVSNILRNAGISDRQILPVLTDRDEDSFSFRVVSNDTYSKLRISKGADIFGEEENVKEYNVMKW